MTSFISFYLVQKEDLILVRTVNRLKSETPLTRAAQVYTVSGQKEQLKGGKWECWLCWRHFFLQRSLKSSYLRCSLTRGIIDLVYVPVRTFIIEAREFPQRSYFTFVWYKMTDKQLSTGKRSVCLLHITSYSWCVFRITALQHYTK